MPSLSSVAAEVLTRKFRDETEQLQKVREAASASEDVSSGTKVLRILERLAKLPVTPEVLKETGVGKEVNDRFVRRHVDPLVRERSKDLVASWKARVAAIAAEAAEQAEAAREKEARKAEKEAARAAMDAEKEAAKKAADEEKEAAKKAAASTDAAAAVATDSATMVAGEDAPNGSTEAAASPEAATSASPEKRKAEDDGSNDAAKAAKVESGSGPNEAIAALFKELSDFEFKKGDAKFKAIAYKKVAARLRGHPEKILSGKEASELPDIGKISAQKIDEFLSDGKIEKLEKYRRGEFD